MLKIYSAQTLLPQNKIHNNGIQHTHMSYNMRDNIKTMKSEKRGLTERQEEEEEEEEEVGHGAEKGKQHSRRERKGEWLWHWRQKKKKKN